MRCFFLPKFVLKQVCLKEEIEGRFGFYKLFYDKKKMVIKRKEVIISNLEMKHLKSLPFVTKM
jgi:hypothetical protein